MTPEELAARHPRLFHVTLPGATASILKRGLLPASRLLELFEAGPEQRMRLERAPRPAAVPLCHPLHGTAVINDQAPMTAAGLAKCLDDGLAPADWLALLNRRVFFWSGEEGLARLLGARANRMRTVDVLIVDTLGLARAFAETIEICPINSGATMRRPARRGLSTFTPLLALPYEAWSRQRGRRDRILEVTVVGGVTDIGRYVVEVRRAAPGSPRSASLPAGRPDAPAPQAT